MVGKIATGEIEDAVVSDAQTRRGKAGAVARIAKLSDTERSEIARLAAEARWKKTGD